MFHWNSQNKSEFISSVSISEKKDKIISNYAKWKFMEYSFKK